MRVLLACLLLAAVVLCAPPPNGDCGSATVITSTPVTLDGDTRESPSTWDNPGPVCYDGSSRVVFYKFTTVADVPVDLGVCSEDNIQVAVTTTCGGENCMAASGTSQFQGQGGCNGWYSEDIPAGTELTIMVGGLLSEGPFTLTVLHLDCHSSCLACAGNAIDECTSCRDGRYLNKRAGQSVSDEQGTCVYFCPDGAYETETGNLCGDCSQECTHCYNSGEDQCWQCDTNYFLLDNQCLEKCLDGTFPNENGRVCSPCAHSCKTCTGDAVTCTTCEDGRFQFGSTCVINCPDQTFEDGGNCSPCSDTCDRCTGDATTCTSCRTGSFLVNGQCLKECPAGFYEIDSGHCGRCSARCESTCTGPARSDCEVTK